MSPTRHHVQIPPAFTGVRGMRLPILNNILAIGLVNHMPLHKRYLWRYTPTRTDFKLGSF